MKDFERHQKRMAAKQSRNTIRPSWQTPKEFAFEQYKLNNGYTDEEYNNYDKSEQESVIEDFERVYAKKNSQVGGKRVFSAKISNKYLADHPKLAKILNDEGVDAFNAERARIADAEDAAENKRIYKKNAGKRTAPKKGSATKRRSAKRSVTKRRSAKRSATKRRSTKRSATKRRSTKRSATKRRSTKRSATKRRSTKRSVTKKRSTKRSATKKRSTKRSVTKRRSTKRSVTKRRSTKRSATKRRSAKKSATKRRSVKKSAKRSVKRR